MPEYLTPGVYFEFQDTAPPIIRRVRSDITGFVGLAERGLLDRAVQIDSWRQFQARFGNFVRKRVKPPQSVVPVFAPTKHSTPRDRRTLTMPHEAVLTGSSKVDQSVAVGYQK